MHKEFLFRLQSNERQARYAAQSRAMHLMAAILLIVYSLPYAVSFSENWVYLLGISLPAMTILLIALFKRKLILDPGNNRIFRILEAGFLMMGSMHYLQNNQNLPAILFGLVSLFMLFLLWMEGKLFREQFILFDENKVEVELPLSNRTYTWSELHAVMLQNDFITLSFKNNTIQQLKVQPNYTELETGDFLFFCQDCIRR